MLYLLALEIPLPNKDVGLASIVATIILAIVFGFLIPRPWHNSRIKDKNEQIATLKEIIAKRDDQHDRLVDKVGTAIQLMEDIKREGRVGGRHRTDD